MKLKDISLPDGTVANGKEGIILAVCIGLSILVKPVVSSIIEKNMEKKKQKKN